MILLIGCFLKPKPVLLPAPVLLPGTRPEMNTPGYWIARHPSPDSVLLSPQQIEDKINRPVREELKVVRDLTEYADTRKGDAFREDRTHEIDPFLTGKHYSETGNLLNKAYFQSLQQEMNLDTIPAQIRVRFAFAVEGIDVRELPTSEGVFDKPDEYDFDELQNSSYDPGTPLVVLHTSRSGEWTFVVTNYNSGWTKTSSLANDLQAFTSPKRFVINLRAKSDLYLNPALTDYAVTVQMGARLPLLALTGTTAEVRIPRREADGSCKFVTAYMAASDVHEDYLSYTPRHAIEQAFEMLNAPYGWSGMFGEQDCSRFLQQVFSCFGMEIPRKSTFQGQTGKAIGTFDPATPTSLKENVLEQKALGGITILQMPGHVVLYLGRDGAHYYAIHATWSYREREGGRENIRVINRVVVSDLDLGGHSKRGSLIFRTRNIRLLSD
jgi:hypothetical protein